MRTVADRRDVRAANAPAFEAFAFLPRSDTPLWRQIYSHLVRLIEEGHLVPGSQLPGEVHLAEIFGVTRMTLRRALLQMQQEGHLTSRKGVGVFVRSPPSVLSVRDGSRFFDSLRVDGKRVGTKTLVLREEAADGRAAEQLKIPKRSAVIRLCRIRSADGQPIHASTKLFPLHVLPNFATVYAQRQSVTDVFIAHGIGKYRRLETRISGGFATAEEATQLALTPGTPLFRTSSVNCDAAGNRVEWSSGCWLMTSVEFAF